MPHKNWYEIKAKGEKSAEINIYGDIGESWWGESITAIQFVKDLALLDVEKLTVRINSYGGSVSDGFAIYNAIKRHKAETTIAIDGVAVSIASLIAMSGDKVEMADNALMMIHAPWAYADGNAAALREAADTLDKFASAMSSSYSDKTGKTLEAVMTWLSDGADHWFTAAEALAENLIDSIGPAVAVNASFDLQKRYKIIPAAAGIFNKPQQKGITMPEKQANITAASDPEHTPTQEPVAALNADDIKAQVLTAENQRRTDIRAKFTPFAKYAGVSELLAQCLDNSEISVQAAKDKLINKLGEGMEPTAGNFHHRIETGETDSEKFARGAIQAINARCGKEKHDPQNEFRGMRLEDVARSSLERSGRAVKGLDRISIIKAALAMRPNMSGGSQTTSDFPVLLENVLNKQLLTAYQVTPDTWSKFCKIGTVSDFREWLRLSVGTIGNLDTVNEAGEYLQKQLPDARKEGVTATRKGNIISITPEIIINDDIGYISDISTNFGRSGKRTIEAAVYALIAANPTMKDGFALFSTDHNNYQGTGAVPSVDSIDAGRVAMASQKDINGNDYLDIMPAIWLGPVGKETSVKVINSAAFDPDTANKLQRPNGVQGIFREVIGTARLSSTPWYMFADPNVAPVIEVVFLDGQSEPILAMEESFNTGGISYRVELPFGVGAIGYEGGYKQAGA